MSNAKDAEHLAALVREEFLKRLEDLVVVRDSFLELAVRPDFDVVDECALTVLSLAIVDGAAIAGDPMRRWMAMVNWKRRCADEGDVLQRLRAIALARQ